MGNCQDENDILKTILQEDLQKHLVEHCRNLRHPEKRRSFQQQLQRLSRDSLERAYEKCSWSRNSKTLTSRASTEADQNMLADDFIPIADDLVIKRQQIEPTQKQLTDAGLESIRNGEVSVILMAGSDSHELSLDTSVGTYDIGLDSACTMFQMLVKRAQRLTVWAHEKQVLQKKQVVRKIKIYVMTNTDNKQKIKNFFRVKKYFGYGSENVFFFSQQMEPVVDQYGRIVLKNDSNLYMSTKGSGVVYSELKNKKIVEHMKKFGVKYVFMAPINNILLKIADPLTLGHLIKENKDIVATSVQVADEPLGYFGLRKEKISIYEEECSDLLKKWASTESCWMKLDFIETLTKDQQFMRQMDTSLKDVLKCVSVYDPCFGTNTKTSCLFSQNYYHQAFKMTQSISIIQVDPRQHFFPIKSDHPGKYSIKNARQAYWNQCRRLLSQNGIQITGEGHVELHPSLTYCGQNIQQLATSKTIPSVIKMPQYLQ